MASLFFDLFFLPRQSINNTDVNGKKNLVVIHGKFPKQSIFEMLRFSKKAITGRSHATLWSMYIFLEQFLFEIALLTLRRQPPRSDVNSGEL
ncbi:hypothetical protein [Desulfovibrio sp. 86]|uniref:Uncharacterized protein n=1 Tax=uncultured Desulfovibrio sp. TaxID=167968 RepID=A0A212LAJ8_9BACT|nr:hypothetical protein [Desulfovibrio sp. 86]SCM74602.1 hypothetical protein KL86DES1_22040 [uncultured Desulfovibrio sp.]VZH34934.1 conserved protein of unknown function [Desulfovibrio sp. 86]